MPFSHHSLEQDGHRLHEIVDQESGYRIVTDNLGAELVSIARRSPDSGWDGFLYRDGDVSRPSKGWASHATVMGYFLHRLKGERSNYEGDEIRGGNHGFLRHKQFADPEVHLGESGTIQYKLGTDQIEHLEYPRKVSFEIHYSLRTDAVEVTFVFHNQEPARSASVSFGLHPGFAVSSVESARIILPRGTYRRHLAPDNFLSGETQEIISDGGTLPIKPFELPGSFLMEAVDVEGEIARLQDYQRQRQVEIDLSEAPYFTIWSDLGPFVCIEPCWGLPDHQQQRPFEQKLGIQTIPAGQTLTKRFSMRFA
jgi:galactose mutarotase-like enzyme